MIGTKLAHYEITRHLGTGGMGEVYQATDSKLGRSVAIKLLPSAFASDADRLLRFRREAQVLASMNHPNTAQIYGLEESGETRFIVMELVEGETLSARIQRGPIPLDECLMIANQIAEALGAAHEKGIVHRDLKPGNVMLTSEGRVKVLDFGLAKAYETHPSTMTSTNSPTIGSMAATNAGVILGTAAYMAPEQARGKPVDRRADIWAFGVMLYEMLTGERLFKGEDLTETLASVVKEKPDLSAVPRRVKRLLEACLEKNPSRRLQSVGDMRLLLVDDEPSTAPAPVVAPAKPKRMPWAMAAVASVLAGIALWAPWRTPPAPQEVVQFEIGAPFKNVFTNWMALAPYGKKVAFTARGEDGRVQLWVRRLDTLEAKAITNTGGNPVPFWSPDSRWIAYQLDNKLRKIEAVGGPSQILCDAPAAFGSGSWNAEGTILFGGPDGIKKVSSNGGVPQAVTRVDSAKETAHNKPVFLPDGKHFLYHRFSSTSENSGAYIGSLDDKPDSPIPARLIATESSVLFAPGVDGATGYILFRRERALMAQPFDAARLTLMGEPMLVADPVGNMSTNQFLNAAASQHTLIVRETGLAELRQITWFDRGGKGSDPVTEPGTWNYVSISSDGTRAAASRGDEQGNFDVYSIDLARKLPTRLTFDRAVDFAPVWSPDGSRIAFTSEREGSRNLFWKSANGATPEESLFKSPDAKIPTDWSRDGRYLLFTSTSSKTKTDIWSLAMIEGERKAALFLGSEANEGQGLFSPDGRFVIYQSDENGIQEIYMRSFPDGAGKWQISKGGGVNPRWSRDGGEIIFVSGGANLMAVKLSSSSGVQVGEPARLFPGYDGGSFDVGPDGRILLAVTSGQNSVNPIKVILNWQTALKSR
jgi:Tol biopolymer transport system component